MEESMFTIMSVFSVLLGLTLLSVAIGLCLRKWMRIKKSAKTTGVVVNNEATLGMRHGSGPRSTLYKPTVRFQTADGRVVDYTPELSNNYSNYQIGENVPVYYNPQKPEEAIAGTPFRLWYGLFVLGIGGAGFAFIGTMSIVLIQTNLFFNLFEMIFKIILR